ncbi:unnamed protein product [Haemonchus placei]|uniref:LAM_G_DOMAIN domain-containing protein n=1 Tax=Haemonchus placei TaxID=6290 RepID=A0A158QR79_HAEPC|nr:unnamed protein product [Haemonchus placei]
MINLTLLADLITKPLTLLVLIMKITVMAHDDGVPAMLSSVAVTVVFAVGSYETCELAVDRDTPIGTKLGNIEEYCNHITKRKILRRFLSDESILTIDSDGNLFVSGVVHKDDQVEFVSVTVNGAVTVYHMRIELSQGNPNPPIFEKKIFHFAVSEDVEHGDMVGVVYAEDCDPGLAGKLLYRIEADELPFKIFPNGTLVISGPLDYEAQRRNVPESEEKVIRGNRSIFKFRTRRGSQQASAQIVIDLLDVDDNPPAIEDAELIYAVTNTEATFCPIITDIDTPKEVLISSVSAPVEIITTDSCIHVSDDVPSFIQWTVSDKSQQITVKVVLLDMLPKSPNIHDENVTMSESAVKGTIVSSYGTTIFLAKRSDQLIVDANDLKVSVERGITDDETVVYAKSQFGRVLKSSKLQLISSNMAPPPVFSKTTYAFNVSDMAPVNTTIHDFQMSVPNDCYLAFVSDDRGKTFCFPVGSTLALCGHLRKPRYALVAEVLCGNEVRSRSEIIITVIPTTPSDYPMVGFLMENVSALAIAQLHSVHGQKFAYRIGDRRLREIFSVSPEGMLMSVRPLTQSIRSVYGVPVVAQPEYGRPTTQRVVVSTLARVPLTLLDLDIDIAGFLYVFVDADAENAVSPRIMNATIVLGDTPTEIDLSSITFESKPECVPNESEAYKVSGNCHITVKESVGNALQKVMINDTLIEITLNTLQSSEELQQSALQVIFYAAPARVADFLTELQRSYTDLTFYPLAVKVDAAQHRNALSLAVIDRNHRVITSNDSRDILHGFFQRNDFPHALLQSMSTSLCDSVFCSNGGICRQLVSLQNASTTFYGSESIWSIPNGLLQTRCECGVGFVGEYCEEVNHCSDIICPDGRCSAAGSCMRGCEKGCVNGMCSDGICRCLAGFSGVDCSIRNKDRKLKRKRPYELKKPSKKRKMNCSEMKCDGGTCQAEGGRAICHCVGGFEAVDCSKAGQAYSMTSGSFTLAPTEQLRSILAAGALSPADSSFCHGSQSIEIDFRTRKSHGTIVTLFYESELAVVEVHASVARYRVFNSYRTLVEITLGSQSVDDGNWHQVVLELSGDRKVITFKVDGIGKQAMSRVVLPSIISADLKRIELGVNGMREQFSVCLRRFVVNGELQSLEIEENYSSEFFTKALSGDVSAGCSVGSAHLALLQKPGVLASLLCVAVFVAAALVVLSVARVVRRREAPKKITWQRTEEIDAYAVHKPQEFAYGHLNQAMSSSSEGPIYSSADGYETPIHLRQQHRKMRSATTPPRTVADIVLAVHPSLSDTDSYQSSSESLGSDHRPQPPPPRGMYRNIAYF